MPQIQHRWLIRRDLEAVMAIEKRCFDEPWTAEEIETFSDNRDAVCTVAELRGKLAGFMRYRLQPSSIALVMFAVDPNSQDQGVGSAMLKQLIDKLHPKRRAEITCLVPERCDDAVWFLSAMGFRAVNVVRRHFSGDDGYLFRFGVGAARQEHQPVNRMADACGWETVE